MAGEGLGAAVYSRAGSNFQAQWGCQGLDQSSSGRRVGGGIDFCLSTPAPISGELGPLHHSPLLFYVECQDHGSLHANRDPKSRSEVASSGRRNGQAAGSVGCVLLKSLVPPPNGDASHISPGRELGEIGVGMAWHSADPSSELSIGHCPPIPFA